MFLLRLFHDADPLQPVGALMVREGVLRIGRDPSSDLVVPDAECAVSRTHVEIAQAGGAVTVRPLGANGVFRDEDGARLADGVPAPLALGDTLRFGRFRLVADPLPFARQPAAAAGRTMVLAAPFGENVVVPTDWADAGPLPELPGEGSLLEAFCEGAGLDVSAFSGEEPVEIMRCAGAVYRQMVVGLSDLMQERSSTRTQYRMDRTTIGAKDNNPFKWAPTRRLATDLLRGGEVGFLAGPDALKASFADLKKHLLGTLAGFRAALDAVLAQGAPERIEAEAGGSLLKSRAAAAWETYGAVHARLAGELENGADGAINQAFIAAYGAKMEALARAEREG